MFDTKRDVDRHAQEVLGKTRSEAERAGKCFTIAKLYNAVNEYEVARKYLSTFLLHNSKSASGHRLMGKIHENLGQLDAALNAYQVSYEQDSTERSTVLQICELLIRPEIKVDLPTLKKWQDLCMKHFPRHEMNLALKERMVADETHCTEEERDKLELLLRTELQKQPDSQLLIERLLQLLMIRKKTTEAYHEILKIDVQFDDINWYRSVIEVLEAYTGPKDRQYYSRYVDALDQFVTRTLHDFSNGGIAFKITDIASRYVWQMDQTLSNCQAYFTNREELLNIQGQLVFHVFILFLLRAQRDPVTWKESHKQAAALAFLVWQGLPPDLDMRAEAEAKSSYTQILSETCYRASQVGHFLYAFRQQQLDWMSILKKVAVGNWRQRIHRAVFSGLGKPNSEMTSYFTKCEQFAQLEYNLPTPRELSIFDGVSQHLYGNCLHYVVWQSVQWRRHFEDSATMPYLCHIFPKLQYSCKDITKSTPEHLCYLDVEGFVASATEVAVARGKESGERSLYMPATLCGVGILCSKEQSSWWSTVHRFLLGNSFKEPRYVLQHGIEVVRLLGNHGMSPKIAVHLARQCAARGRQEQNPTKAEALKSRATHLWKAAISLLERISRNRSISQPQDRLFNDPRSEDTPVKLHDWLDEGRLYVATSLLNEKKYEEAVNLFRIVKSPYGVYYEGLCLYHMATEETSSARKSRPLFLRAQSLLGSSVDKVVNDTNLHQLFTDLLQDIEHQLENVVPLNSSMGTNGFVTRLSFTDNERMDHTINLALPDPASLRKSFRRNTSLEQMQNADFDINLIKDIIQRSNEDSTGIIMEEFKRQRVLIEDISRQMSALTLRVDELKVRLTELKGGQFPEAGVDESDIYRQYGAVRGSSLLYGTPGAPTSTALPHYYGMSLHMPPFYPGQLAFGDRHNLELGLPDEAAVGQTTSTPALNIGTSAKIDVADIDAGVLPLPHAFQISMPAEAQIPLSNPIDKTAPPLAISTQALLVNIPAPVYSAVQFPKPKFSESPSAVVPRSEKEEVEHEYDPMPEFKPIIPLPDEVEQITGEEGETVLFQERAKLYRLVNKEWKERGIGLMKILCEEGTNKVRLVMRREQVLTVCANHRITPEMSAPVQKSDRDYIWAAKDYADSVLCDEQFCVRFKTAEEGDKFKAAFLHALELAKNCTANDSQVVSTPEPAKPKTKSVSFGTSPATQSEKQNVGGFVFTSAPTFKPVVEQEENKQKEEEKEKTKPFASFSFNMPALGTGDGSSLLNNPVAKVSFASLAALAEPNGTAFAVQPSFRGFEGAGESVFGSPAPVAADVKTNADTSTEEFEPTVDFTPVVPLPALVELKTGEEEEEKIFGDRCKLFRFVAESKEWKERGVGEMKLLRHNTTRNVRLLMRREQVLKVCCNHALTPDMTFEPLATSDRAWTWFARDYAEGVLQEEKFALKFRSAENALVFKKAIDDAQALLKAERSNKREIVEKEEEKDEDEDDEDEDEDDDEDDDDEYEDVDDEDGDEPIQSSGKSQKPTLSLAEMFKRDPTEWECSGCFLRHKENITVCPSCETPKPGHIVEGIKEEKPAHNPFAILTGTPTTAFKFGSGGTGITSTPSAPSGGFNLATTSPFAPQQSAAPVFQFGSKSPFVFGNSQTPPFGSPATTTLGLSGSSAVPPTAHSFLFGSTQPYEFSFSGVSPKSPKSPGRSRLVSEGEQEESVEESELDGSFQPVVPLPDKVEVRTGEEDEDPLFIRRAKLFRFVDGEWKERGVGELKILKHQKSNAVRLLMRRDQVLKICLNHYVTSLMKLNDKDAKSVMWAARDYADEEPKDERFAIRFKAPDDATAFKDAISSVQSGKALPVVSSVEEEISVVFRREPTEEQIQRARKLMLPDTFYLYEDNPDCPGCRGCSEQIPTTKTVLDDVHEAIPQNATPEPKELGIFSNSSVMGLSFSSLANQKSTFLSSDTPAKPVAWAGAGLQVFASVATSPANKAENAEDSEEVVVSEDPHFEPIIALPDLIEVVTGEEDEDKIFGERAKLYRFDAETKQWKERGIGEFKILKHKSGRTYRFLLRREQVHKVVCNHLLTAKLEIKPMVTSLTAWCWNALNYAEGEGKPEQLSLKFKTQELAAAFKEKVEECQLDLENRELEEGEALSGDEGHDYLFDEQATLYCRDGSDLSWRLLGKTNLQVYYDDDEYCAHVVAHDESSGEELCNHLIGIQMSITPLNNRECTWNVQVDKEGVLVRRTYRAAFQEDSAVSALEAVFVEGVEYADKLDVCYQPGEEDNA